MQAAPSSNNQIDYQHSEIPKYAKPVSKVKHYFHLAIYYGTLIWENTVIFILALQSLHALYTASKFIIDDYPELEQQFSQRQLNSNDITAILTEAIGLMIATLINILFAIRLSKAQERVSREIELVLGTALIIWYQPLLKLLQSLDYTMVRTWILTWLSSF